jgi:hypothetical protein
VTTQNPSLLGKMRCITCDCKESIGKYLTGSMDCTTEGHWLWVTIYEILVQRSACDARAGVEDGCVATKFIVFFSSLHLITFLPEGVDLGSLIGKIRNVFRV